MSKLFSKYFLPFLVIFQCKIASAMNRQFRPMRSGRDLLGNNEHLKKFSLTDLSFLMRKMESIEEADLMKERPFRQIFGGKGIGVEGIMPEYFHESADKVFRFIRPIEEILDKIKEANSKMEGKLGNEGEEMMKYLRERTRELVDSNLGKSEKIVDLVEKLEIPLEELEEIGKNLDKFLDKLNGRKRRILLGFCLELMESEKNKFIYANLLALARMLIRQFLSWKIENIGENRGKSAVKYLNEVLDGMGPTISKQKMKISVVDYVRVHDELEIRWNRINVQLHQLVHFQQGDVPNEGEDRGANPILRSLERTEMVAERISHFYIDARRDMPFFNSRIWFLRPASTFEEYNGGILGESEQLFVRDSFEKNSRNFYKFYFGDDLYEYLYWKLADTVIDGAMMEEMAKAVPKYLDGVLEMKTIKSQDGNELMRVPPHRHEKTMEKIWDYIRTYGPYDIEGDNIRWEFKKRTNPQKLEDIFWRWTEPINPEEFCLFIRIIDQIRFEELKKEEKIEKILEAKRIAILEKMGIFFWNLGRKWKIFKEKMERIIGRMDEEIVGKIERNIRLRMEKENKMEIILERMKQMEIGEKIVCNKLGIECSEGEGKLGEIVQKSKSKEKELVEFCGQLTNFERNELIFGELLALGRKLIEQFLTFYIPVNNHFVAILAFLNAPLGENLNRRISILQLIRENDKFEVELNGLEGRRGILEGIGTGKSPFKMAEEWAAIHLRTDFNHANMHPQIWHLYSPADSEFAFNAEEQLILRKCIHKHFKLFELMNCEEIMDGNARGLREKLELHIEPYLVEEMRERVEKKKKNKNGMEKLTKMEQIWHQKSGKKIEIPPQVHQNIVQKIHSLVASFAPSRQQNEHGGEEDQFEETFVHFQVNVEY